MCYHSETKSSRYSAHKSESQNRTSLKEQRMQKCFGTHTNGSIIFIVLWMQSRCHKYIYSFVSLWKNIHFWCLLLTRAHFFSNIFSDYGLFTRYSCSYVLRTRSQLLLNFTLLNSIKCIHYVLSMRRVVKHSYHFSMTNECATHHSDEWAHITYVEFHFKIAIQGNSVWYSMWCDQTITTKCACEFRILIWVGDLSNQTDSYGKKR